MTDYAPFGVIGAITPVTHSLPTLACQRHQHARGRATRSSSTPTPPARRSPPRASAASTRRSATRSDWTTCSRSSTRRPSNRPAPCSITAASSCWSSRAARPSRGPRWRARSGRSSPGREIPPVVVDATADLDLAAASIIFGAAFDNNLLCIGEKQVFAVSEIFDKLMDVDGPEGGVPPQFGPDRRPDPGRVHEGRRRQAPRQQGPRGHGPLGARRSTRASRCPRTRRSSSARRATTTRSSTTSR